MGSWAAWAMGMAWEPGLRGLAALLLRAVSRRSPCQLSKCSVRARGCSGADTHGPAPDSICIDDTCPAVCLADRRLSKKQPGHVLLLCAGDIATGVLQLPAPAMEHRISPSTSSADLLVMNRPPWLMCIRGMGACSYAIV